MRKWIDRNGISPVSIVILLIIAACAQFLISAGFCKEYSRWILLFAVGGIAVSLRRGSGDSGYVADHESERSYRPKFTVRVVACLSLAAGVTLLFISSRRLTVAWHATYYRSFLLMAAGYILASLGLDHIFGYRVRYHSLSPSQRRSELLLFLLVMATAVFLRTYRFDYYPPPDGLAAIEEAQQGDRAYNMLCGGEKPWEFLFSNFVTALSFKLFGVSTYALRIPPVVLSILTVAIAYFMLRTLVGYRCALFASFLFAVSRWHLTYARISHNVFLPAALVLLCVYLLYRTTVSSRPSLCLWIGCSAGVLLYEYAPYRCTVAFVIIFFTERAIRSAVSIMKAPSGGSMAALGRALLKNAYKPVIVILALLVLAIPLIGKLKTMPGFYFEAANRAIAVRTDPSWYDTSDMRQFLQKRIERIRMASQIFTVKGEVVATFNKPSEPMLDPYTGIIFVLAVGFCTLTLLRERHTFIIICFYSSMAMGFLFPHNFDVRRMITLIPQVYALVGLVVLAMWRFAARGNRKTGQAVVTIAMCAVSLLALGYNHDLFFNKQITDPDIRKFFWNEYTEMITRVHQLPKGSFAMLVSKGITNFFLPNDYKWLRGFETRGMVVEDPSRAIALARLIRNSSNVSVIISDKHGYDVKGFTGELKAEFPVMVEERFAKDMWGGRWTWAVFHIPSKGREGSATVEGYLKITGSPASVSVVDSRGKTKAWKESGVGKEITWETGIAPEEQVAEYLFAGSSGAGGKFAMAELSVNGHPALEFELGYNSHIKRWEKKGYVLEIIPVRTFRGQNSIYHLTVPAGVVVPGEGSEISVKITQGGKDTWFAIHDRGDCWSFSDYGVVM